MWGFMICFHINMSMPRTRSYYVSNIINFMDTYSEHVHAVDTKEQTLTTERLGQTSLEDIAYGG